MSTSKILFASLLAASVLHGMPTSAHANTLRVVDTAIKDSTGARLAENYDARVPVAKVDEAGYLILEIFGAETNLLARLFNIYSESDPDPYARYHFTFENDSTEDLGASMSFRMETGAFSGPSWRAFENLDISLTDRNGDGAYLIPLVTTTAGNSFQDSYRYVRFPDGSSTFGFSFFDGQGTSMLTTTANGSETFSFNSGPATFADYFGGDPWNSLGFQVDFLLSPGDIVDFSGGITVSAVPLPGAIWLFGSGILAVLGMGRRVRQP